MSTLKELIYYCKEEHPIGALLLTGEWGCGKTYLIEKDLTEALSDSHVIVRISLFGVNSIDGLHHTVKNAWLDACMPVLGKIHGDLKDGKQYLSALTPFLKIINPMAGVSADAVLTVNSMDLIPILPEIEDPIHGTKKVILVFDDMERSRLNQVEMLGVINEYCENKHFNTIIIANENTIIHNMQDSSIAYNEIKEKIIARTLFNDPDYPAIIHSIIHNRNWPSQKYADFLAKNENLILEVFHSESPNRSGQKKTIHKYHNIRSLISALQNFHRIYHHMTKANLHYIERYMYSFIAYTLVSRCGIEKDGCFTMDFDYHDIQSLYPFFTHDTLPESVREWIKTGRWDKKRFLEEIQAIKRYYKQTDQS